MFFRKAKFCSFCVIENVPVPLMVDNCRPHRANLVEDFLFEEGIVLMEWPACPPEMNPIEHVWDALGRRVAGRPPNSPRTGKSSSGRVGQNTPTRD
ncbi:transposable element Tcb2 transposase [Trichonephila clavipes]|nr:transposable element Tcb2 transposase [Trichonephila clavipes]